MGNVFFGQVVDKVVSIFMIWRWTKTWSRGLLAKSLTARTKDPPKGISSLIRSSHWNVGMSFYLKMRHPFKKHFCIVGDIDLSYGGLKENRQTKWKPLGWEGVSFLRTQGLRFAFRWMIWMWIWMWRHVFEKAVVNEHLIDGGSDEIDMIHDLWKRWIFVPGCCKTGRFHDIKGGSAAKFPRIRNLKTKWADLNPRNQKPRNSRTRRELPQSDPHQRTFASYKGSFGPQSQVQQTLQPFLFFPKEGLTVRLTPLKRRTWPTSGAWANVPWRRFVLFG